MGANRRRSAGVDLITAASDTATEFRRDRQLFGVRRPVEELASQLISVALQICRRQIAAAGRGAGWNCRDVEFFISRIWFDAATGQERSAALNAVETRFELPAGPGRYPHLPPAATRLPPIRPSSPS